MTFEDIVKTLSDRMLQGGLAPWKAEDAALEEGLAGPENITAGVAARRAFVEAKSGHSFRHIMLPERPYHTGYRCPNDQSLWTLAAEDTHIRCGMCDTPLEPLPAAQRHKPLVNNYIGGIEDYFSYAGEVTVGGDVRKTFQNILCWGPGVGHLGISVGCFKLNKYGPIEVQVSDWGIAARNLSFVFSTEPEREKAKKIIQQHLPEIIRIITAEHLSEWGGEIVDVDTLYKQHHGDRILHCCFYSRFENHRGHGQTSHAAGRAKLIIDDLFRQNGVSCRLSVVGMGRDGDLKPSPRNRRGRYVSAQQTIPVSEYEKNIGRPIEEFFSYIELDRQAVTEEIGWPAYTGMGGEIIPAFYRTMKNNPRPYLVSCFQKVYASIRGKDLVFGVELPNVEVGITSSPEGIISPMAREALRMAGITSAKEYAAALAAVTLGGEFNFATLHVQERMYTGR
ncbi:MAG: hypothetical protein AMJ54_08000 [Deltaproteobacteria bacterium SG8_13]|nr:MAG: hypothetical protein AMJ54_08000 [Deltaproteobacteria bacterium SG8_13]